MRQSMPLAIPRSLNMIALPLAAMIFGGVLSNTFAATSIPQGLDASWTIAASTGTPDDATPQSRYNFHDDFIEFNASAPVGGSNNTIRIRYNMAVPEGFFVKEVIEIDDSNVLSVLDDPEQFGGFKLLARFRDNGADEQVVVRLMELNSFTGVVEELIRFDSDDFEGATADSDGFKRATADCIFEGEKPADASSFNRTLAALGFDFSFLPGRAYFVKADLIRNSATGTPALSAIEITRDLATCGF